MPKQDIAKNCEKIKIQKLLCTSDYKARQEIIQKYGYSDFAIWFQEESFFNYWQVHCNGSGVPLYDINLAKRRKLRRKRRKSESESESKNQTPENDDQTPESDMDNSITYKYVRMEVHEGKEQYKCKLCNVKFIYLYDVQKHLLDLNFECFLVDNFSMPPLTNMDVAVLQEVEISRQQVYPEAIKTGTKDSINKKQYKCSKCSGNF